MLRFIVASGLLLLLAGCSRHREPVYQSGWVNVGVTDNSVDVSVRPGHKDGNVDVYVDWP